MTESCGGRNRLGVLVVQHGAEVYEEAVGANKRHSIAGFVGVNCNVSFDVYRERAKCANIDDDQCRVQTCRNTMNYNGSLFSKRITNVEYRWIKAAIKFTDGSAKKAVLIGHGCLLH